MARNGGEGITSHIVFYGLLLPFWIDGEGHWCRPSTGSSPKARSLRIYGW